MKKILVVLFVLFMVGCVNKPVPAYIIETAKRLCEQNGGLSHVSASHVHGYTALCNNGAIYENMVLKRHAEK